MTLPQLDLGWAPQPHYFRNLKRSHPTEFLVIRELFERAHTSPSKKMHGGWELGPGDAVYGTEELGKILHLTRKEVRKTGQLLASWGLVVIRQRNGVGSVATILFLKEFYDDMFLPNVGEVDSLGQLGATNKEVLSSSSLSTSALKPDSTGKPPTGKGATKLNELVKNIVGHLNSAVGKNFRPENRTTIKSIVALTRAGYDVKTICSVIDLKTKQWKADPKMSSYLQPATLLRPSNFENYVDELQSKPASGIDNAAENAAWLGESKSTW